MLLALRKNTKLVACINGLVIRLSDTQQAADLNSLIPTQMLELLVLLLKFNQINIIVFQ